MWNFGIRRWKYLYWRYKRSDRILRKRVYKTDTANEHSNFYFSKLWVDNKAIVPGDDTGILSQSLPYTRKLELNHDQNNLIIHFALSDYGQQLSEKWFQYKLEGLDKKLD